MLKISNVKVSLNEKRYAKIISQVLNVREKEIKNVILIKQSVDARRAKVHFICSFAFEVNDEKEFMKKHKQVSLYQPYQYQFLPSVNRKVLVVGCGPAGLFCSYVLAKSGVDVTLVERGKKVEERVKDIHDFMYERKLNTESNILFGEGGAGTFSDGKLTASSKNKRVSFVLETFVKYGAPKDILYLSKPHIGTDYLRKVIVNMRNALIDMGVHICFETKFDNFKKLDHQYEVLLINKNVQKKIIVDDLVLAIGHSARDTYEKLYHNPYIKMESKSFAIGVRIEQAQKKINQLQYHQYATYPALKAANYKLAVQTKEKRGVYTFCMCPGGQVVPCINEENHLCINGMSEYARDKDNANSAILVTVNPEDFQMDHPLAGIEFQKKIERKAFEIAGNNYNAPVQLVNDYFENKCSQMLKEIKPSYLPDVTLCDLNRVFPEFINRNLKEGLKLMNLKMPGFIDENTLLVGVETRSSSPVKILRNQNYHIENENIYPIGEGAGKSGGIVSSAIDGIMCAESILKEDEL